jgi:hypothetical protein
VHGDGVRRVGRHLVVGLVAVLDAQVIVYFNVEARRDQLVLDETPDDAGHLVPVELDHRGLHLDLRNAILASAPVPAAWRSADGSMRRAFARVRGGGKTTVTLAVRDV